MDRQVLMVAACLCCYASGTWAADPKDHPIIKPTREEQVVCHRERVTGTHFRVRVCRTQAMIDQERADAKQFMRDTEAQAQSEYRAARLANIAAQSGMAGAGSGGMGIRRPVQRSRRRGSRDGGLGGGVLGLLASLLDD